MRNKAEIADQLFTVYTSSYDQSREMIHLKVVHTLEVARVMDQLTFKLGLSDELRELAHITAVFHDIGRFEQVTRYGTYLDHLSVDHADFGCDILRDGNMLEFLKEKQQQMVLTAIHNHNKYAIEEGLDEETLLLSKLIRDADKADIFRVFACEDLVDTMGETLEQVEQETITDAVYDSFMRHECIDKLIRRTGLDKWVGFLGFFYDIYYDETIELLMDKKYYRVQFDRAKFASVSTREQAKRILEELENYIQRRF